MASEGRVRSCRYCGHDTENADGVCGPCATVEGRALPRECSFCQRTARWRVSGEVHLFFAYACARHAHQALDLALQAGNDRTVTTVIAPARVLTEADRDTP